MKIHIIAALIISLLLSGRLQAQEELNPYLKMAAENNPGLQQKFNEYLAALEKAPQVSALPDPQISFAYFISPVETRLGPQQFRISASQFFPWFGSLAAKEDQALQNAKAKYELFEESKSKLFRDVKALYYNLYFNQRSVTISHDHLDLLRTIRNIAIVKVESGQVSMVDEYRIQMEIKDLENRLALLKDKQWSLETGFRNLLNAEKKLDILLPDSLWSPDFPYSKQTVMDSIRNGNHQLLKLEFDRSSLEYRKEAARLEGKPDFRIGVDYTFIGSGENNLAGRDAIVFPVVGISIPLYREKYKAMMREVTYLETAKENESLDKENALETLLDRSWKDYLDADRRIRLNQEQMELAERSLELLQSEYSTANREFEEILRMERKLLQYRLEFEKAKTDKQASIAFLKYLMGK